MYSCPFLLKFCEEDVYQHYEKLRGEKSDIFSLGMTLLCHVLSLDSKGIKWFNKINSGKILIEEKLREV